MPSAGVSTRLSPTLMLGNLSHMAIRRELPKRASGRRGQIRLATSSPARSVFAISASGARNGASHPQVLALILKADLRLLQAPG